MNDIFLFRSFSKTKECTFNAGKFSSVLKLFNKLSNKYKSPLY